MHRHEISVLSALKEKGRLSFDKLLDAAALGKDEARWAIANLVQQGLVDTTVSGEYEVKFSKEGEEYAKKGLPETALLEKLENKQAKLEEFSSQIDQIGINWAKRKGLVEISGKNLRLTEKGKKISKGGLETEIVLKALYKDKNDYSKYKDSEAARELEQRKLIEVRSRPNISEIQITKQGIFALAREKQAEEAIESLDRSMIASRAWAGKKFKPYDVSAPVEPAYAASRHTVRRIVSDIRSAYIGLGFSEISGPIVEPAFWVFDYLFVPQDHPARDVQDTFFLSKPRTLPVHDKSLEERIRKEHEAAWHSEWSSEFASRAILRTHTTSVTGRYIHSTISAMLAHERGFEPPIKLFTVGRVFRNENLDYKHLADFYMTDGIVVGKNLTLAHLFDILSRIYGSVGVRIRFKPAYFPFVEPGVEVHVWQNGQWLELGGAGIIRREVSGVDRKDISVLAWGLGVERIALVKDSSIGSIVDLYNSSAGKLRERRV
ncbi:MAG: phenylalanine--tRNA ligase subunit alpha [Candidatus Micrarchaeota archaeon]|nr:phenylalanine--tRNA ligase subunit alpha [Candidatus Micrarchaeota archaeon]